MFRLMLAVIVIGGFIWSALLASNGRTELAIYIILVVILFEIEICSYAHIMEKRRAKCLLSAR
jgi:hypothetical protein